MTGPLPPIVTLKHLAEWAGYDHDIPKKQAIQMFTGFVADIGRVLKKGSKIRIPNLGVLQVRIRPARPARKGRNPATGEEIQIKASKASKQVAFRVATGLRDAICSPPSPPAFYQRGEHRAAPRHSRGHDRSAQVGKAFGRRPYAGSTARARPASAPPKGSV